MISVRSFIKSHCVALYFLFTFALSWGCMAAMISPYSFPLTVEESAAVGPFLYVGMLVGPSVSGLLMIGLVDGWEGYRGLLSRLTRWRLGVRWYAAAVFGTPMLASLVLFGLSLFSPVFTPALITSSDKMSLIGMGVGVGLMVGVFEELGWSGFAVPKLRRSYSVLVTGVLVGLLWGLWHFPPFWEHDSFIVGMPLALLVARLFAWLPPFRVLMVWVHDRTGSLSLTMLMHGSLVFSTLALPPATLVGVNLLIWLAAWGAVLWVVAWLITSRIGSPDQA